MQTTYDAIIVGARCGGSPTAMIMARKGHRVLVNAGTVSPAEFFSPANIGANMAAAVRQ